MIPSSPSSAVLAWRVAFLLGFDVDEVVVPWLIFLLVVVAVAVPLLLGDIVLGCFGGGEEREEDAAILCSSPSPATYLPPRLPSSPIPPRTFAFRRHAASYHLLLLPYCLVSSSSSSLSLSSRVARRRPILPKLVIGECVNETTSRLPP